MYSPSAFLNIPPHPEDTTTSQQHFYAHKTDIDEVGMTKLEDVEEIFKMLKEEQTEEFFNLTTLSS